MDHSNILFSVRAHEGAISNCFCCKHSNQKIFTYSDGDVIKLWSIPNKSPLHVFNQDRDGVLAMRTNEEESLFAYCTTNHKFRICDIETTEVLLSMSNESLLVSTFDFLDSKRLVCGLSNSRIQIFDMNSKSLISELIGHQHPIVQIRSFPGSPYFYTLDSSDSLMIWDKRTQDCLKQCQFPHNSHVHAINGNTFVYYGNRSIHVMNPIQSDSPLFSNPIAFQPSRFFSLSGSDILISSSLSLYRFSINQNRISNLGEFQNVVDVGMEQSNHIPIVTTQDSNLVVYDYSFPHSSSTTPNTRDRISCNESSILSYSSTVMSLDVSPSIRSPGAIVRPSSVSLDSSYLSEDSSVIVSDDSFMETVSVPSKRKEIKPRLSVNTIRSPLQRASEVRTPSSSLPQPRKTIALTSPLVSKKPVPGVLKSPVVARQPPRSPQQSPVTKHTPSLYKLSPVAPSSQPQKTTPLKTVRIVSRPSSVPSTPSERIISKEDATTDGSSILSTLVARKEFIHSMNVVLSQNDKQEMMKILKSTEDSAVISVCLKECESLLMPSTVEEMIEICSIVKLCLCSKKELWMLSACRFLQRSLQNLKNSDYTHHDSYPLLREQLGGLEMVLLNIESGSIRTVLLKMYIKECTNLLGEF